MKDKLGVILLLAAGIFFPGQFFAKQLSIGISFSIPPYVIKDAGTGLELEILREAFKVKGYTVTPVFLPLARTFMHFNQGKTDGVLNVKEGFVDGFYSDEVINFQNCAISLKDNNFNIDTIEDLADKRIVAFQMASKILGTEFGTMAEQNKDYLEIADQSIQLNLLFKERTDVVVMDKRIFNYFKIRAVEALEQGKLAFFQHKDELQKKVQYHCIFPPSRYKFAFITEQIRDDFNLGLRSIKKNGVYDAIFEKYKK